MRAFLKCAAALGLAVLLVLPGTLAAAEEIDPEQDTAAYPAWVIATGCQVEQGGLMPGAANEVTIRLKNTSSQWTVYGIVATARWTDDKYPVQFDTVNQTYVEQIAPGEEAEISFTVQTKAVNLSSFTTIPLSLTLNYTVSEQYGGAVTRAEKANTVTVQIPVYQEEQQETESVQVVYPAPPSVNQSTLLFYAAGVGACLVLGLGALLLSRRRP